MDHLSGIFSRQQDFFHSGKTKDIAWRRNRLESLYASVSRHEKDIADALGADFHRPELMAYESETGLVLHEIAYTKKHLATWARPYRVRPSALFPFAKHVVSREPLGVGLIAAPFNFPFSSVFYGLIGAIAAGNCAIIKPSEVPAHSAALLKALIQETFPEEYVAVVLGEREVAEHLLTLPFDHIYFIGSSAVGKIVMAAAAKNLTPLLLGLSGKNPAICDATLDLKQSARKILWAKYFNAGQVCTAVDHVYIPESRKEEMVACFKETLEEFYGTDPKQSECYERIINDRHFDRIIGHLNGATILHGGEHDREERYIAPTLIAGNEAASAMTEEVFGPILPVLTYRDFDDLRTRLQARSSPLAVYVFSRDRSFQDRIIRHTRSGAVVVNDAQVHTIAPTSPTGGVGQSGFGRMHGKYIFDEMTFLRHTMRRRLPFDLRLRFPPYSPKLLPLVRRILR